VFVKKRDSKSTAVPGVSPDSPLEEAVLSTLKATFAHKAAWLIVHQRPLLTLLGVPPLGEEVRVDALSIKPMGLTQTNLKVLIQLFGKMEFRNWIIPAQAKLAKELGMSPQAYNRAISDLQKANVLLRPYVETESGIRPIIMLNPELASRGGNDDKEKAVAIYTKMAKKQSDNKRYGHRIGIRKTSKTSKTLHNKVNKLIKTIQVESEHTAVAEKLHINCNVFNADSMTTCGYRIAGLDKNEDLCLSVGGVTAKDFDESPDLGI
jgi:hypothetical protein